MDRQRTTTDRLLLRIVMILATGLIALAALFVVGWIKLGNTAAQQHNDEQATCLIQSRGLPASKHLAAAISDINMLLSLRAQNGSAAVQIPPDVVPVLLDLKAQTGAYARIEAKQPGKRTC
jgi:hypothetical protein